VRYDFGMPKAVYIQVHGVEKPVRLFADKVEHQAVDATGNGDNAPGLIISKGQEKVGEFKDAIVDGWWYQDEEGATAGAKKGQG
jgi:hypothetical protein